MKEKVKEVDITKNELPHTRRQVFFDLLKHQKRQMVSFSMLLFVFFLPLVVDVLIFNQYVIGASLTIDSIQLASSTVFSLIIYMMIISIPCMMVGFVGLGGMFHVLKNIVWQEGVITGPDFFSGIKKNWKQSLIFGLIFGLSLFLLIAGSLFLLRTQISADLPWVHSIGIGLCVVQFIIISIVIMYAMNYSVYYSNSSREVLKNSFIFFTAKFFKNILLFILTIGILVVLMFIDFIAQIVVFGLFALFSSFMFVSWTLLTHEAFDQYINKDNYPDFYEKGLYKNKEPKEE